MQTFTGKQYLQMDIAASFGLDKEDWDVRLDWFKANQHQLHNLVPQAETPALFYAGIIAHEAVERGEPIGYPISLDATASGLQLLACLTGDRTAAQICNVVNTGHRQDAYTSVWKEMQSRAGEAIKITRQQAKDAVMPSFYGSKRRPKDIFGEGALLTIFDETMATLTPGPWELNSYFLEVWDSEKLVYQWQLPDNFQVRVKVKGLVKETVRFLNEPIEITRQVDMPTKRGRSLSANTVHSLDGMVVRELTRRCNYDPAWIKLLWDLINDEGSHTIFGTGKDEAQRMVPILWQHYVESGYLSARILDYLDADTIKLVDPLVIRELLSSLPQRPFQVISVHDCFRCLPQYGNDLRRQYNRQLFEIARSNLLSWLLTQITGEPHQIGKLDETLADDILEADYALS